MAPKGLVCPQWYPWSLVASEAAHRQGRQAFLSKTTGLCRELGLEETEEAPLCLPAGLGHLAAAAKNAPCTYRQHPHTGLLSFPLMHQLQNREN